MIDGANEQGLAPTVNPILSASLWMLGAIACFTTMAVAGREVSLDHDTFELMFYRSCVGIVIVVSVISARGLWGSVGRRQLGLHFVRNVSHFTGQNLWFYAVGVIPLAQVFALEFTSPLWVLAMSPIFLAERITAPRALAAFVGFLGILVVTRPFSVQLEPGVLAALGYMAAIAIFVARNPDDGPAGPRATWAQRMGALRETWSLIVIFALVIVGMYRGWFTPTEAAAVGAFGTVLRSVDGGQSWSQVEIEWPNLDADQMGIQPHLYDVQFGDDGTVMVVGEYAVVLRSDDGGVNWRVIHRGDASIFALKVAPGGNGYAVGQDGLILRTTDGGQSWERRETESKANLFSVQALPNGHVVVAGMREWLTSEDGGSSWTSHREDVLGTAWFTDLALSSSGRLMAVGQAGQVIEVRGE